MIATAIEFCVPCAIDLAHPACAKWREDFVGAEARAGGQGQMSGRSLWANAGADIAELPLCKWSDTKRER